MTNSMDPRQDVRIRHATLADADVISAITDAAYAKYLPRMGRKPRPMTADYRQMLAAHPIWILTVADHPVGVLVLEREPGVLLIYSVAIHPGYQRRGFGRMLLAWAEQEARHTGYDRIRLYTNSLMTENIALYTRLGYHETGRESYHDLVVVHFSKSLGPLAAAE